MDSRFNTRTIVEAGMMLALAVVLGLIKPFSLPFGGSVTAGSMIPLLLIAMMRGPVVGITVGVLCGIINYFLGGWLVSPVQWLLDYPLAFGALGLAGFVWNPVRKGTIKLGWESLLAVAATIVGLGGRFISHFLAGVWFWGSSAPEGMPAWKYSLGYQASYLVPEIILSAVILYFLAPPLFTYLKNRE
ncbi:MAG: energy-coupled thiamine transporter ThiT [Eubacteriales bacterium]|nr:energy-coupled thiamine transporter ThiT [Eubacteriales bacterium]